VRRPLAVALLASLAAACAVAPAIDPGERPDPPPEPAGLWAPRCYPCVRAAHEPVIDGSLDEACWEAAPWTDEFVDIRGDARPKPRLKTRAKMLWNDDGFYVAAALEEPEVWATLTERDSIIFEDNDFEVFIDPDHDTHHYFELEINAFGTEWDLFLVRPYRDGGPAIHAWDIPGLRTAVKVDGTINRPGDRDRGWTLEIAFPWKGLAEAAGRDCPPKPGDLWRVNLSRVEWRTRVAGGAHVKVIDPGTGKPLPEDNWVWSPQGLVNMHYPEMWGFVRFVERDPGAFAPGPDDRARWALRRLYFRERAYVARHGRYTTDLAALGLATPPVADAPWPPSIAVTPHGFEAALTTTSGTRLRIDHEGRVR
jgi:hypothetical protein